MSKSVSIYVDSNEAEDILLGIALIAQARQGKSKRWEQSVEDVIHLGTRLSTTFERQFKWDEGCFERHLAGTPVVPAMLLPPEVPALYGLPSPIPHPYKRS